MNTSIPANQIQELNDSFSAIADHLIQLIKSVSEEELNTQPPAGGWSAGQVADHIFKTFAAVKALQKSGEGTNRSWHEKVPAIRDVMGNREKKYQSPDSVRPSEKVEKNVLISKLEKRVSEITGVIVHKDLTETCREFVIPGFGEFTRWEWIQFMMAHTKRHNEQLERTINEVKNIPV